MGPRVHLINPSNVSFGVAVITPRWLFVLAAATGTAWGDPVIVDETLETHRPRDDLGRRRRRHRHSHGQRAARLRDRPDRPGARRLGRVRRHSRHAVPGRSARARRGARGRARRRRSGLAERRGRLHGGPSAAAVRRRPGRAATSSCPRAGICCRKGRYMWASVQTVRGCPKHCSFCSVWRTDGQEPRQRGVDRVVQRNRRAAPPGLPVHRARRRQLLSGHARRSRGGQAAFRSDALSRAARDARRSGSS